jgi:hypothetical protein
MSTNDTARMQAGILVMDYDPRTASCTVRVLSNSGGFEVVRDETAGALDHSDVPSWTEFAGEPAGEPAGWPRSVCAASVQHNFRAGRHPGNCKPGKRFRH